MGPTRVTEETWRLLDEAAAVSPFTKREIIETGTADRCRAIIQQHQTGGTTDGRGHQAPHDAQEEGRTAD